MTLSPAGIGSRARSWLANQRPLPRSDRSRACRAPCDRQGIYRAGGRSARTVGAERLDQGDALCVAGTTHHSPASVALRPATSARHACCYRRSGCYRQDSAHGGDGAGARDRTASLGQGRAGRTPEGLAVQSGGCSDLDNKAERARIKAVLKMCVTNGWLRIEARRDAPRWSGFRSVSWSWRRVYADHP